MKSSPFKVKTVNLVVGRIYLNFEEVLVTDIELCVCAKLHVILLIIYSYIFIYYMLDTIVQLLETDVICM